MRRTHDGATLDTCADEFISANCSVWAVADGARIASVDGEIVAYAVLDLLAKPVFGAWLLLSHDRGLAGPALVLNGFWSEGLQGEGAIRVGPPLPQSSALLFFLSVRRHEFAHAVYRLESPVPMTRTRVVYPGFLISSGPILRDIEDEKPPRIPRRRKPVVTRSEDAAPGSWIPVTIAICSGLSRGNCRKLSWKSGAFTEEG